MPPRLSWLLALASVAGMAAGSWAQIEPSRCADCHFSQPDAPESRHLSDWDQSAHGRNAVGCETCHGGNPHTFESFAAHQGILGSTNPASPVAPSQLPATCGKCHPGPLAAFQRSRHYGLLQNGTRGAPTCVTCHDEVAASRLSPRQLEAECARCHGAGKASPNVDFPREARLMMEGVREARALLNEARSFIRRIADKERRARLEALAVQAEVPLREAAAAGHAFVFDGLQERLGVARERIGDLYQRLANPASR